ncbi:MAG: hypothetical protein HY860_00950 [Chlamydiales bacterium]|nr:hypothetical protein [Chlamydiales bacterium]
MSEEDLKKLKEFAQKIAIIFYQQGLKSLHNFDAKEGTVREKLKGFRLPFGSMSKKMEQLSSQECKEAIDKASITKGPVKISYRISTDYLFKKRLVASTHQELFEAAIDAHQCCQDQDLHLMAFKRLLLENGLSLRQIKDWKFPESKIAKKSFEELLQHLSVFCEEIQKKHAVNVLDKEQSNSIEPIRSV